MQAPGARPAGAGGAYVGVLAAARGIGGGIQRLRRLPIQRDRTPGQQVLVALLAQCLPELAFLLRVDDAVVGVVGA